MDTATPDPSNPADGNWWAHSLTVWGTIITGLSTVLPLVAPLFGLKLTPDLVHLFGDQVVAVVQAIAGLAGTIMAIVGRTRATPALLRRSVVMTV